jgi:quinol monooxygenase YgiN
MTLIVAGTVRAPRENIERLHPHMLEMMTRTRAEDGCLAYGYAEDVAEPGLIHVFELWRDQPALDAHFQTAHMAAWRAVFPQFQVTDRKLKVYDVAAERAI